MPKIVEVGYTWTNVDVNRLTIAISRNQLNGSLGQGINSNITSFSTWESSTEQIEL